MGPLLFGFDNVTYLSEENLLTLSLKTVILRLEALR
jgi:hypothetical protein